MPDDSNRVNWFLARVGRHCRWARDQGIGRLVEEDNLNPVRRARIATAKRRFRSQHVIAPRAIPVFVVGLQRSGTNMVVRGLDESAEFEVHNENDRRAFERFRLRDLSQIRRLVEGSNHRYVLLKPLCDSHRTAELLDNLGTSSRGRAVWVFREVGSRTRSALAKFGPANRDALVAIAAGRGEHMWQSGGLTDSMRRVIAEHVDDAMTPGSAAALFWYLRNRLFLEVGLDRRNDVTLVSYEAMLSDPEGTTKRLCRFLDVAYSHRLHAHVEARAPSWARPLDIDPRIRRLCDDLDRRLRALEDRSRDFDRVLDTRGGDAHH
jgi:hypothetical protein